VKDLECSIVIERRQTQNNRSIKKLLSETAMKSLHFSADKIAYVKEHSLKERDPDHPTAWNYWVCVERSATNDDETAMAASSRSDLMLAPAAAAAMFNRAAEAPAQIAPPPVAARQPLQESSSDEDVAGRSAKAICICLTDAMILS
jgi:hypothetical protein